MGEAALGSANATPGSDASKPSVPSPPPMRAMAARRERGEFMAIRFGFAAS
jgi:hypothetical protein